MTEDVYGDAEKRVTALEMSPLKDQFASGDTNSVKVWDLNKENRCIVRWICILSYLYISSTHHNSQND